MKRIIICIIFTLLPLSCGCYNLLEINDAAVAQNFSIDLLENGQLAFYAQTTQPVPRNEAGEATPTNNITVRGKGDTVAGAARNMYLYFPRVFLWIHANNVIIGENLARENLAQITDFLLRNRSFRLQAYVFVTHDASVQEVLKVMDENSFGSSSARSIERQVEMLEEDLGYYVPIRIKEFLEYLMTPGIEPVIPQLLIVKKSGQEKIEFQGMAVVKKDRVIGSLSEAESQGFHFLRSKKKEGGLLLIENPMEGVDSVSMEITSFSSKIRPEIQGGQLKMKVSIYCELRFLEEVGTINMYCPAYRDLLENQAQLQVQKQIRACINKAQLLNSDILGWGLNTSRYEPDLWDQVGARWEEVFPRVTSTIDVKAVLRRDGRSDSSFQFK